MTKKKESLFQDQAIAESDRIVNEVRHVLAGQSPEVIGAALVQLVSQFLAYHHPDLRADLLKFHHETVSRLITVEDHILEDRGQRPKSWPPIKEYDW